MKRLALMASAIFMLTAPSLAESAPAEQACSEQRSAAQTHVTTVKVNGMVCDFCARAVIKVFTKNELVDAVDVDLDAGAIIFETHGCVLLDEASIKEMVHYSGYDFVSIERSVTALNSEAETN